MRHLSSSILPSSSDCSTGSSLSSTALPDIKPTSTSTQPYTVSDYERNEFYNGVTSPRDHPVLLYRSDFTTPFPKPQDRFPRIPSRSVREVYNTSLNPIWSVVGPQIRDIVETLHVFPFSIDPARFLIHRNDDDDTETLGPPVVWVGVPPNSIDSETAHSTSQTILALLAKNGAHDVVVQWREANILRLMGPVLMDTVDSAFDPTSHIRRPFTSTLNVPLAPQEGQADDSQGSLTFYFHENKDKHGRASTAVLGVSNCHVLRKDTKAGYVFRGLGAPKQHVRALGARRFQQALDETRACSDSHASNANYYFTKSQRLEAIEKRNEREEIRLADFRARLNMENSDAATSRNIGFLRATKAITVHVYTEDWEAFQLDERKFEPGFKGTTVDLGNDPTTTSDITAKFYAFGNTSGFRYPEDGMYKIERVAPPELLANPDTHDDHHQPCIVVGKDGTKTGLTFGRYAGLESYLGHSVGVSSMELGIYNWDHKSDVFSDKGDSGALVWDGKHRAIGQIHSGAFKSQFSSSHVCYATPAWWLVERIKVEFPHAIFFHETWSL